MELDLAKLVNFGPIENKIEIHSLRMERSGSIIVFAQAQPFWAPEFEQDAFEPVTLQFQQIDTQNGQSTPQISLPTENSSSLSIRRKDGQAGMEHSASKIYCNSPIPYPSSILLRAEAALLNTKDDDNVLDCFGTDMGGSLNEFTNRTKQGSFLLSDSPTKAVHDALCNELKSQNVDFTVLDSAPKPGRQYRVAINQDHFECDHISLILSAHNTKPEASQSPMAASA